MGTQFLIPFRLPLLLLSSSWLGLLVVDNWPPLWYNMCVRPFSSVCFRACVFKLVLLKLCYRTGPTHLVRGGVDSHWFDLMMDKCRCMEWYLFAVSWKQVRWFALYFVVGSLVIGNNTVKVRQMNLRLWIMRTSFTKFLHNFQNFLHFSVNNNLLPILFKSFTYQFVCTVPSSAP